MTCAKTNSGYKIFLLVTSLCLISFSLMSPDSLIKFAIKGLDMCGRCIVPSIFPFMIFSEMLIYSDIFNNLPRAAGAIFEKAFRLPPIAASAFFIGLLCGFPLGVKHACDLYSNGLLSKDECERLICFVNNTGPSFIIAAVGVAMRKSPRQGVALYLIQIFSAIFCGLLLSKSAKTTNYAKAEPTHFKNHDVFCFSEAVKRCSVNSVYICGFVTFFSIVCGFSQILFADNIANAIICSLFEIGNAAAACVRIANPRISFSLTAFAISFSGLSVHMQSKVFLDQTDLNTRKYYFWKILQAILSFVTALAVFPLL